MDSSLRSQYDSNDVDMSEETAESPRQQNLPPEDFHLPPEEFDETSGERPITEADLKDFFTGGLSRDDSICLSESDVPSSEHGYSEEDPEELGLCNNVPKESEDLHTAGLEGATTAKSVAERATSSFGLSADVTDANHMTRLQSENDHNPQDVHRNADLNSGAVGGDWTTELMVDGATSPITSPFVALYANHVISLPSKNDDKPERPLASSSSDSDQEKNDSRSDDSDAPQLQRCSSWYEVKRKKDKSPANISTTLTSKKKLFIDKRRYSTTSDESDPEVKCSTPKHSNDLRKRVKVENKFENELLNASINELSLCDDTDTPRTKIKKTIDRFERNSDVTGDGSKIHCLPTLKHGAKTNHKRISVHTVAEIVEKRDKGDNKLTFDIIDSRYPHEFNGGHIKGAINIYTLGGIIELLKRAEGQKEADGKDKDDNRNHILIFHCEFSSERGPKMYDTLRNEDRKMHIDKYPFVLFPEIYLMEGGYKNFFTHYKHLCDPQGYTQMLPADYHENKSRARKHKLVMARRSRESWSRDRPDPCLNRSPMSRSLPDVRASRILSNDLMFTPEKKTMDDSLVKEIMYS